MHKATNLPTIADVARLAGVSIATVSRVLNGTTPVAEATARRVQEAIDEMRFVPHTAARRAAASCALVWDMRRLGLVAPVSAMT